MDPMGTTHRHRIRTRHGVLTAGLAAAGLLVAACGGGGDGAVASAGGDAAPAAEDTEQAQLDDADAQALVFAECMRDNGVDMPDPGPGQQGLGAAFQSVAGNYDRATLEQAVAACEDLIPSYQQDQPHAPGDMLALAECLREQGLDVSDNPFDDAHAGAVDVNEFSAAMEVCRDELVGGGQ
jgi:hypothetical protein